MVIITASSTDIIHRYGGAGGEEVEVRRRRAARLHVQRSVYGPGKPSSTPYPGASYSVSATTSESNSNEKNLTPHLFSGFSSKNIVILAEEP